VALLAQALGGQFVVGIAGRRDDHELDADVREHLLDGPRHLDPWMLPGGIIAAALHHAGEFQARRPLYDCRVKIPPCQAKSHHANANRLLHTT
jgi:hypothetical protein